MLLSGAAGAGDIRAKLKWEEPVLEAWALQRQYTKVGVYARSFDAKIDGDQLILRDLPVPGRYDLKFRMKSGVLEGWDATVPESDYVEEQPLSNEARLTILKKTAKNSSIAFGDQVIVHDMVGNIQNAAVLLTLLRKRAFVGGGYKPGEWVWRVERWQWEDPMEHTWTVIQERPFYTLVRKRFYESDYKALRTTYARHLGGILLDEERSQVALGTILLPRPKPGTHAINADGTLTKPMMIKPWRISESNALGHSTEGLPQ